MRILILNTQIPFVRGGAESLADDLRDALQAAGHDAEIVALPFNERLPEQVAEQMLACRLFDLSSSMGIPIDRVIGLKFPAYLVPHPHKTLWLVHQYRQVYDLWDHPEIGLSLHPLGAQVRAAVRRADQHLLRETRRVFTISGTITRRLATHCDAESTPLLPPPRHPERFFCAPAEDYLFFPSRLAANKRQGLALEALARTKRAVRLRVAGPPDLPVFGESLRERARELGVQDRVEFLGYLPEEEKLEHFARALGVLFPPLDEDYGLVTAEAMLAGKPVITCTDSGGPLELVDDGETGLVASPMPDALAEAMDHLWSDHERARRLGDRGRRKIEGLGLSWPAVVERLLS